MTKFIAAMDHSGGSTGTVLDRYEAVWNEDNKMKLVNDMRLRMINSPDFTSDNIWGAILYSNSFSRGLHKVLNDKGIMTFLKIDSGCDENGLLKQFPVKQMIEFANQHSVGAYGTKMRSIIKGQQWIKAIVQQQFNIAATVAQAGLMPIVEPEIPIESENKSDLEISLLGELNNALDEYDYKCILKLTPPDNPDTYFSLTKHPKVHKVVFLSGGYTTEEACKRLKLNQDTTASFSRALSEGLYADQTDEEFNERISNNIKLICEASSEV